MTEREQEAWDRFAAAALEALVGLVMQSGARWTNIASDAAWCADALMVERAKRTAPGETR